MSTEYPDHDDESGGASPLTGVIQSPEAAKTSARREIVKAIVSYTTFEATDVIYAALEFIQRHPEVSIADAVRQGLTQIKKHG